MSVRKYSYFFQAFPDFVGEEVAMLVRSFSMVSGQSFNLAEAAVVKAFQLLDTNLTLSSGQ